MVRKYNRKTEQQSWSEESMAAAVQAVTDQMSLNSAAEQYGIPVATLYRKVKKVREDGDVTKASKKGLGRYRPVFTAQQEEEIMHHVLDMEARLFGLTRTDLRSLAYQYAVKNNIPNPFDHNTCLAGIDWVYGFMQRHKELSLRQPENTSAARAAAFNPISVSSFFQLLGELMDKYHFTPNRIYNADETGITTVPNKPSKIIAARGKKQVGILSSAERGTLVTAEICFNAAGHYIPPLLVFPRVRHNPLFEQNLPPQSKVVCHQSGWMQTEIYAPIWFNHFVEHSKPTRDEPVLLIIDGHKTHTANLELVEQARTSHVHILVIPPHTSHRLQPLDISFMFPLSKYYEQEARTWLRNNPGKVITIIEVGSLFSKAYMRAATVETAANGFKRTGICPYNAHIFPDDLFSPSETTDRPFPANPVDFDTAAVKDNDTSAINEAGPSKVNESPMGVTSKSTYVSPRDILPIPVAKRHAKRLNKRHGKTMILTSSPALKELQAQKKKVTAEQGKPKVAKRLFAFAASSNSKRKRKKHIIEKNEYSSSSASSVESDICDDKSETEDEFQAVEDDFTEYKGEVQLVTEKVQFNEINNGDFLLIELHSDKSPETKKQFVGKVVSLPSQDESNFVSVKFMRSYRQKKDVYVWPTTDDTSIVYHNEIVGKLCKVKDLRHGQIRFSYRLA